MIRLTELISVNLTLHLHNLTLILHSHYIKDKFNLSKVIIYNTVVVKPCQTSMTELFCENIYQILAINYFRRKSPS